MQIKCLKSLIFAEELQLMPTDSVLHFLVGHCRMEKGLTMGYSFSYVMNCEMLQLDKLIILMDCAVKWHQV